MGECLRLSIPSAQRYASCRFCAWTFHMQRSPLTINSHMLEEMNLLPENCVVCSSLNLMSRIVKVGFSVGKFCISLEPECVTCWKLSYEMFEKQHLFGCRLFGHYVFCNMLWEALLACPSYVNMFRSIFWTYVLVMCSWPAAVHVRVVICSVSC